MKKDFKTWFDMIMNIYLETSFKVSAYMYPLTKEIQRDMNQTGLLEKIYMYDPDMDFSHNSTMTLTLCLEICFEVNAHLCP